MYKKNQPIILERKNLGLFSIPFVPSTGRCRENPVMPTMVMIHHNRAICYQQILKSNIISFCNLKNDINNNLASMSPRSKTLVKRR